jgi:hypothetical protein
MFTEPLPRNGSTRYNIWRSCMVTARIENVELLNYARHFSKLWFVNEKSESMWKWQWTISIFWRGKCLHEMSKIMKIQIWTDKANDIRFAVPTYWLLKILKWQTKLVHICEPIRYYLSR